MLVDANVLIYAVDERSRAHSAARNWLEEALNGSRRIGLPWQSLLAFVRIVTHPRALPVPLTPVDAWSFVADWLDAPAAWVPDPGRGYRDILTRLVIDLDLRGNLVSDAALAALAIEHGLAVISADSDFARFPELIWLNPLNS
ncbi:MULTISPECIES: TA system VapC family ribonuclease toxin [Acidithrix]|uniref:Ribonuclease VapC n=1 Tax=Acidithrix ferrooxidans TaxID=1280514 RepID=A0A0D8HH33_9ACTN|nr:MULTISPECIES: TA system VapC family ribonuclease toxin [Acidithrix]KJF17164.1 ribonuclease VapC37 [Acidithrix ferrooxidans]